MAAIIERKTYPVVRNMYETTGDKSAWTTKTKAILRTSCGDGDILLSNACNERNERARDDPRSSKAARDDSDPENPLGRFWRESRDDRHREENAGRHRHGEPVILSGMSHVCASGDRSRGQGDLGEDVRQKVQKDLTPQGYVPSSE